MSESQLNCGNCGYKWMTRGEKYSLRCPQCGALLPDQSGGKGISSYVLIALIFVGLPVASYLLWAKMFAPEPLPAPPVTEPVDPMVSPPVTQQPMTVEPKTAEEPQSKPAPEVVSPKAPSPEELAAQDNRTASRKLSLVRPFLNRGDTATARKRLNEIIEKHPDSDAANEARSLLKTLESTRP